MDGLMASDPTTSVGSILHNVPTFSYKYLLIST